MSRKNKWRRRGRLEFRRETARLSDGTLENYDRLFIRIKGKACVIFGENKPLLIGQPLYLLAGTYRLGNAGKLVSVAREYLNYKSNS